MSRVVDETLSRAVVTYVWGDPQGCLPSHQPDAVHRLYDDQAEQLLLHIRSLFAQAGRIRPASDLATYGARIEDLLRRSNPALTDEARAAIAALLTYAMR